ncbi:MAG TPA: hypothetical protein VMN60_03045 [Longimicrobiales bacterium]|nr:hypothetical protein [Longimicrobiales bacterium]
MTPIIAALLFLGTAVAIGRWRKLNAIQWIWLITGLAIGLMLIWFVLVVFVVGPEMRRTLSS